MSDGSTGSSTESSSTPETLPSFEAILEAHRADDDAKAARRPAAWRFFRETLGQPKFFLAPMVDCSVLPFRLLCKRHGTDLGVSPMIHACAPTHPPPLPHDGGAFFFFFTTACFLLHHHRAIYVKDATFRKKAFQSCAEDRPSIAQLAGRDADAMVQAARMLEDAGECAAVDVNLGCPQRVAKKGAYGAYLADDPRLVEAIVGRMCRECRGPVTCKMRVTDSVADSVAFAQMLERCGCAMITVHGRTKSQISVKDAPVNWATIARIVFVVALLLRLPFHGCCCCLTLLLFLTTPGRRLMSPWLPTAASARSTTPSAVSSRPRPRPSWLAVCCTTHALLVLHHLTPAVLSLLHRRADDKPGPV